MTNKRQEELRKQADLHIDAAHLLIMAIYSDHAAMLDPSYQHAIGNEKATATYEEELEYLTNYIIKQIKVKWGIK